VNAEEKEQLEAQLVNRRIAELRLNPIRGNFDIAHLKETHHYIFQDLPGEGLWKYDVQPGEFRTEVPKTMAWHKGRDLDTIPGENGKPPSVSSTFYSRMDSKAIAKLEVVLEGAKPENFKGLSSEEFSKKMAKLYGDLDYAHPFQEGNSRTLREFTAQIAREAGVKLNWKNLNSKEDRDLLYIARDRELANRAGQDYAPRVIAEALYDVERHKSYPSLAQLIERNLERVQTA